MNIHQIIKSDTANGIGTRISVFVSGCRLHCKDCHNKAGQDFDYGIPFTNTIKFQILNEFEKIPVYDGITILGGDPLEPENQKTISSLLFEFKDSFPDKTVWLYTGRIYEELCNQQEPTIHDILSSCDVLIDGPFMQHQKNPLLEYRGSENQRIIDLNATRKTLILTLLDMDRHDRISIKKGINV